MWKAHGIALLCLLALTAEATRLVVQLDAPPLAETPGFTRAWLMPRGLSHDNNARNPRAPSALPSVALRARTAAEKQQAEFLEALEGSRLRSASAPFALTQLATESGVVEARFTTLINALVLDIGDANEFTAMQALRKMPHVVSVSREHRYKPMLYTSLGQIGAFDAWTAALANTSEAGMGVKIAMVDSGLWVQTAMFRGDGMAWPTEIPSPGLGETTNTNQKIVVSRMYPNPDSTYTELESHTWPGPNSDPHGLHTGSTAAGRNVTGTSGMVTKPLVGVAPAAWLMNYRIFMYSASSSEDVYAGDAQVLQAFEDIVADGADICSNSWGDAAFENGNNPLEIAIHNMIKAGVVMVFAAGNSGPYPISASWISGIRVAAVSSSKIVGNCITTEPTVDGFCAPFLPASFSGAIATGTNHKFPLATPDLADILACTNLTGRYNFTDHIAVVKRGTCTFYEKAVFLRQVNAAAIIVFNTETEGDTLVEMAGSPQLDIPIIFVGNTIGSYLVTIANASIFANATLHPSDSEGPAAADRIASFSSRGPTVEMQLSPDIAAPGVYILASGYPREGYGFASGTSMATPHISGAAAILKQHHPTWSVDQIKSAMMNTAEWKNILDYDGKPAQPLDMGAGRLALDRALDPSLFISPPSLSFGAIAPGASPSIDVTITSTLSVAVTVDLRVLRHTGKGTTDTSPSFAVSPSSTTIPANGTVVATVTLNAATKESGDLQAFLVIENASTSEELAHAPIWGRYICSSSSRVNVMLVDADMSECGYTDVRSTYEAALTAAGLTFITATVNCNAIAMPTEVTTACYDMLVLFSGDTVSTDFYTPFQDTLNVIMHMGVPVLLAGRLTAINFIPSGYDSTTFLYYGFDVLPYGCCYSVNTITESMSLPSRFAGFSDILSTVAQVYAGYRTTFTPLLQAQSTVPVLTSLIDTLTTSEPHPTFDTIGLVLWLGLEHLSNTARRGTLMGLVFDHATEKFQASEVTTIVNALKAQLTIMHVDGFDAVNVAWGDGTASSRSERGTTNTVLVHEYAAAGNYSVVVVMQSALGRYFSYETVVYTTPPASSSLLPEESSVSSAASPTDVPSSSAAASTTGLVSSDSDSSTTLPPVHHSSIDSADVSSASQILAGFVCLTTALLALVA